MKKNLEEKHHEISNLKDEKYKLQLKFNEVNELYKSSPAYTNRILTLYQDNNGKINIDGNEKAENI